MRVGVTSDTTCLGIVLAKVSDIEVEEASYTFPTYDASARACGMELEIPLSQNIQSNLGSSPSASVPRFYKNVSQQTSHDLNILSWNLQVYSHEKYKVLQNFHIIVAQEAQYPQGKDVHFHKYQCYRKEREGNPLKTLALSKIPSVRMTELETQSTLVIKIIFKKFQLFVVNIHLTSTADDVAITTFDSCAGWVVEQFLELSQKYGFNVNLKKSNYIANKKKDHKELVDFGITKVKYFKYLGIFISPRGNITEHRKYVQIKTKFLCVQVKNLSRILPLRHMTQLWLSYIKPHSDYVAPLMKNFDFKEIEKWRLIDKGKIKRILCLAKSTANKVIDELWQKFGLQPTSLMKQTDEQIVRLFNFKKQSERETQRVQIDKKVEQLQWKRSALSQELDRIRQEDLLIIQRLGFFPNFSHKMKYLPAFGYLERYKHSWKKCNQCGCQWSFEHVERHDPLLFQDYLAIESYINQCAMEQSYCYKEYNYRKDLCFHFYKLNKRFNDIVEQTTISRSSEVIQN